MTESLFFARIGGRFDIHSWGVARLAKASRGKPSGLSRPRETRTDKAVGSGLMKENTVYILLSLGDGKTYTGSTDNLRRRLEEHNNGRCRATMNRRPLRLIYFESFDSLDKARKRELYLKTRSGRRELKEILDSL